MNDSNIHDIHPLGMHQLQEDRNERPAWQPTLLILGLDKGGHGATRDGNHFTTEALHTLETTICAKKQIV